MKVVLMSSARRALNRMKNRSSSSSARTTAMLINNMATITNTRDPPFKGSSIGSDTSMIDANHRFRNKNKSDATIFINSSSSSSSYINASIRNNMTTRSFAAAAAAVHGAMDDEYGDLTADGHTYIAHNFELENGVVLPQAQVRYQTYGTFRDDNRDNVIVVCHALTGNASLHSWWGDLLGPNKAFDTSKYMIVCCNILGSCYGSTSPQSINPETSKPYSMDFPDVSVQDTVKLQLTLLQEELNIKSVKAVIGGSFGGMQAVEFAVQGGRTGGDFTETGSSGPDGKT